MMDKPIEQKKENQIKIIKIESVAAAKATPLLPPLEQKEKNQAKIAKNESDSNSKPLIWDCGSSLYDSFELKSFERQLDSAINSRTLSMPHLADRRVIYQHHPPQPPPPPPPSQPPVTKKSSKISRSFHKLLRSVFKPKAQSDNSSNNNNSPFYKAKAQQAGQDGFYVVYDRSRGLSTIPEVPEFHALSPEINSLVRRTASDRFTATSIGISCA